MGNQAQKTSGVERSVTKTKFACCLSILWLFACESVSLPEVTPSKPLHFELQGTAQSFQSVPASQQFGTRDDSLPFEPTGQKLASIAWRTWIYTDPGPHRTRLGYLRAGQVVDARGPSIQNAGCQGGWYRINPRGFVCLGKGASLDLAHPVVKQLGHSRPKLGEGFPYLYAVSRKRSPDFYFRLPTGEQMQAVEGAQVLERGVNWLERARKQGLVERLSLNSVVPDYLQSGMSLQKPYGVAVLQREKVTAGRAPKESGFALVDVFSHEQRGFGVTTELDLIPLDRTQLIESSDFEGLELNAELSLPVAFHVRGALTVWRRSKRGAFSPAYEQREKRGFGLSGRKAKGGMLETTEGDWLAAPAIRVIDKRTSFPSVATGTRKWLDISIKGQTLVAYQGRKPLYATLVSTGKGLLGDPETESATIRGTFMIHEKSVSSTMDGDEDRSDSYSLKDVPFVQYFHRGFALHGAYWHNDFGRARSHGCINLSARDAARLFRWTDPPVPYGWHAALNKQRGTVVYVHP